MEEKQTYINTTEALKIISNSWIAKHYKLNLVSLITWIKKYDLGFKFAGRWQVDKDKLREFIERIPNGRKKTKK